MGLMVDAIAVVIDEVQPDVIVTFGPDGITGHPDHIETGRAVTIAAAGRPEVELLYATHSAEFLDEWRELHNELGVYMGAEPDGTRPEDHVLHVELDGAELDRKRASLASHASQTAMLSSIMGEATYREWIRAETFRAPTPADFALQPA